LEAYLDGEGGAGDDTMLDSDPTIAALDQCGILDLNDIMTDTTMGGLVAGESTASSDILTMFAEEGEQDCSAEQERQYEEAAVSFKCGVVWCGVMLEESSLLLGFRFHISRYCTHSLHLSNLIVIPLLVGWNIDDGISEDVLNDITEQCKGLTDSATSMLSQPDMNALNDCVGAILGDNPLGDLLRDIYHTPDKMCSCVAALEDAIPSCLYIIIPEELMPEGTKGDLKIPLSLVKKECCVVGIACAALDDMCATELEALDLCLPPADQASFSCMSVMEKCALESEPPFSMEVPPELTAAELPDACQRVYTASALMTNVPERCRHFNSICNNAGPTPATTTTKTATATSSLSSPEGISASENVSPHGATSSSKPLGMVGVFLAASVVAAVYLVLGRRRARSGYKEVSGGHAANEVDTGGV
jgi:hypothetical protein